MSPCKVNYELLREAGLGNEQALAEAYEIHKKLIYSLIKKYKVDDEVRNDLFQVGTIGLLKAIQNFDETLGFNFSTYAFPLISGEIKRYFRENGMLKVSRSIKDLAYEIIKMTEMMRQTEFREPSMEEISSKLGVSFEEIILALESRSEVYSLEATIDSDSEFTLADTIGINDDALNPEKMDLHDALKELNPKEQMLINMRYYQGFSQTDVAARLFISQVQVSRIERQIILKLQKRMKVSL